MQAVRAVCNVTVLCIVTSYEHKIREHLPGTGKNPGCGTGCGAATKLD